MSNTPQTPDGFIVRVVTETAVPPASPPPLEKVKLAIELLRIVAWPALVLALVIVYRVPIRSVMESLATKFAEASKVTIGTLSLEIQEKARQIGSSELARQVGTLSPSAIQELLQTPQHGTMILLSTGEQDAVSTFALPSQSVLGALTELESKNMIRFREKLGSFMSFFRALPMRQIEGAPERTTYAPTRSLSDTEVKRLNGQGYELTDTGRKATEAIVQAVVEQLR